MNTKKKPCKHNWAYDHVLYQGRGKNAVQVHRQCRECGLHQRAAVAAGDWKAGKAPSMRNLR